MSFHWSRIRDHIFVEFISAKTVIRCSEIPVSCLFVQAPESNLVARSSAHIMMMHILDRVLLMLSCWFSVEAPKMCFTRLISKNSCDHLQSTYVDVAHHAVECSIKGVDRREKAARPVIYTPILLSYTFLCNSAAPVVGDSTSDSSLVSSLPLTDAVATLLPEVPSRLGTDKGTFSCAILSFSTVVS